ncbi:cell wall-binding repeat-containing protein [Clostridium sp.]
MNKNIKKLVAIGVLYSVILSSMPIRVAALSTPETTKENNRLFGKDRYETSSAIAKAGWESGSDYVIIASGSNFADALCAAPLTKKYNAPMLLSEKDKLSDSTRAEIKALKSKHAIIIGGKSSISASVEEEIKGLVGNVERISGKDRFETSVKAANKLGTKNKSVVVANGYNYADALSVGSVATINGMPILLSDTDKLSEDIQTYLKDNNIAVTYVVGGNKVISDNLVSSLPGAIRIGGENRFETNQKVMETFSKDLNFEKIYVATGNEFADALSGVAIAAKDSSPMVLASKGINEETIEFLNSKITSKTQVIGLGGEAVLENSVITSIEIRKNKADLEALIKKARSQKIDTTREEGAVWFANFYLNCADWDEQNVDKNIKLFNLPLRIKPLHRS